MHTIKVKGTSSDGADRGLILQPTALSGHWRPPAALDWTNDRQHVALGARL